MMIPPGMFAGKSVTLAFFASAVSEGAPGLLAYPASIQAGDLIVLCNSGRNNSGAAADVSPAGYTAIFNVVTLSNTRVKCWYKIADGTEGATNTPGLNGGVENDRCVVVFRGDVPIGTVNVSSLHQEQTDNAPSSQSLAVGQASLVQMAVYRSSAAVTTRGFSPGSGVAEITPANTRMYVKYLIVNGAPVAQTISQSDDGISNTLASFNLEVLPA